MSSKVKDALLGEPHGTAGAKLRKALLFKYVQLAGHDQCHRCGKKIEHVDHLSIEHTEAWQKAADPRGVFFDLDKIAFSHLSCNIAACERYTPPRQAHGYGGYTRGCKCDVCRAWKAGKNAQRGPRGRIDRLDSLDGRAHAS